MTELQTRKLPLPWLVLGLVLPTLVTWVYFDALSTAPAAVQQTAFSLGKGAQFALPIIVLWLWHRHPLGAFATSEQSYVKPKTKTRLIFGIGTGLAIAGAILGLYFFILYPAGIMDGPRIEAKEKLGEFGIDAAWKLLLMAIFYSLLHSGFEEYYWRRFVFQGLTQHVSVPYAVTISSLGFASHHVLVLARYFGWSSPWTYLLAAGVAVGGAIWAIMVSKFHSLIPSWISHAFVDASLFIIAFHLVS